MTIYMFQETGDEHYASDMMREGFDHLALVAEYVSDDGHPVVTADEYRRWTQANAYNDPNGAYYPDGIAELVPFHPHAVMVCSNPDLGDDVMVWRTTGGRNVRGAYLYELTGAGDWVAYNDA